MTTLGDWEKDIDSFTDEELVKYDKAFRILHDWDLFEKAFKDYGIKTIWRILLNEACRRKNAFCAHCLSGYLISGDWAVTDLIECERGKLCPECYEEWIKEGLIHPEV